MIRDLRRYASQTTFQLIAGGLILLFIVGDGLIYIIFGSRAAMLGLFCLAGGLVPIGVIILILAIIDWVVRRSNSD